MLNVDNRISKFTLCRFRIPNQIKNKEKQGSRYKKLGVFCSSQTVDMTNVVYLISPLKPVIRLEMRIYVNKNVQEKGGKKGFLEGKGGIIETLTFNRKDCGLQFTSLW